MYTLSGATVSRTPMGAGVAVVQDAAPQGQSAALTSDEVSRARQEHDMLVASMRQLAQAHGLQHVNPLGQLPTVLTTHDCILLPIS